jgi:murein DD-endopeptidase MepM/ murein hydrolase activator NlpD
VTLRLWAALLGVLVLGACATQRAPVKIVYGPPVDYGPPGDVRNPPQGPFQPNAYLKLCAGMGVSNAPTADTERWVVDYKPVILVGQIVMVTAPAQDVCLASGFGLRGSRPHDGIDLTSTPPGTVYAAAPGRVIEARWSSGYGYQALLDHGRGVYTRYAHLDSFDPGLVLGSPIGYGQPVGQMGATGNAEGPHLHFEVLTGNYDNPRGSKGLTAHDPFAFPPYEFVGY